MARSDIVTWLPLDRFAQIIGLNPLHFNGFSSSRFPNTVCGELTFQSAWQHSDRVGRDDIAMAIQSAEIELSQYLGFNLLPDWVSEERLDFPRPGNPEMYGIYGVNPRGLGKSVELKKGHIVSGGFKVSSQISAGLAVVRSDSDGDGYSETCTVTFATTLTNANEIRLYYPGKAGADAWEIRPITVNITAGVAMITFKAWQIPVWESMTVLDVSALDADNVANYETTVDAYRVYNDPSVQVQFLWENNLYGYNPVGCCGSCIACQLGTQYGCFHFRDQRLGMVVPGPGTWDATTQEFNVAEWSACREPDQVKFWYYSGWVDLNIARPYVNLSPRWEYAIAYFAAGKLDRPVCGCSNVNQFIDKWRRDAAFSSMEDGGFKVTAEQASNKLGTTMGALYAYRQSNLPGVRVIK